MDAATAGLLGVIAGGVFGFIGALLATWSQSHAEEARWRHGRSNSMEKAYRKAVMDFVRRATRTVQRMHWLQWQSRVPGDDPKAAFAAYDTEMRELLPELFASGAVLDMLLPRPNPDSIDGVTPTVRIVTRITNADALIGGAEMQLRSGEPWADDLEAGFSAALAIHDDLLSGYPWSRR